MKILKFLKWCWSSASEQVEAEDKWRKAALTASEEKNFFKKINKSLKARKAHKDFIKIKNRIKKETKMW